mmetsp:Transcript_76064/g.105143  ORF Transcript_76064/g.105143 Transcript_76064/m.105143 type:complete len:173 (+) Transcript_76064:1544-2062(+)
MFSLSAYYLAGYLATSIILAPYPLIIGILAYFLYGFPDPIGVFRWLGVVTLTMYAGSSWGYAQGCAIENDMTAIMFNQFFIILFNFGAGVFVNGSSGNSNIVVSFLCKISPMFYTCQLLFDQVLDGTVFKSEIMNFYGYTYLNSTCYLFLIGWIILFFLLGWLAIFVKHRHL